MINFRFHLISLVAVFLALGVGVAMGASFVDRATVDSLRDRVDDLDAGYRKRGAELEATSEQLADSDSQATALAAPYSEAITGRLSDQPVVLVVAEDVSSDVFESTRSTLAAAGATLAGTLRIQPSIDLQDEGTLRRVRDRLALRTGDEVQVRGEIVGGMGSALAVLAFPPELVEDPEGDPTPKPGSTTPSPEAGVPAPVNPETARAYLAALMDLGLITIDGGGAPPEMTFPEIAGIRYVMVVSQDAAVSPSRFLLPVARALARTAPAVLTVAEAAAIRPDGEPRPLPPESEERGGVLVDLVEGDLADQVSTIDNLEEAFGRIALVYAIGEQRDHGSVGHYGTGARATAPFPTVPPG